MGGDSSAIETIKKAMYRMKTDVHNKPLNTSVDHIPYTTAGHTALHLKSSE